MGLVLVAFGAGLCCVLLLGPGLIDWLARNGLRQPVRSSGPPTHQIKRGTPTFGGLLLLLGTGSTASLLFLWRSPSVALTLGAMLTFALIGLADDLLKVKGRWPCGLPCRYKLAVQFAGGLVVGWIAWRWLGAGSVPVPGLTHPLNLGALYPFAVALICAATANAVNLTDGVDGLLATAMLPTLALFGLLAWQQGDLPLVALVAALAGSTMGYLPFNWHPARVFMGDVGSHALGGALAALAVLTRSEFILPVAGGLYVWETLTVILQVVSHRLAHRRIFRMSPYHHHLELGGLSEVQIVLRLGLLSGLCAATAWWLPALLAM